MIFKHHTRHAHFDPRKSGVEWWVQVRCGEFSFFDPLGAQHRKVGLDRKDEAVKTCVALFPVTSLCILKHLSFIFQIVLGAHYAPKMLEFRSACTGIKMR